MRFNRRNARCGQAGFLPPARSPTADHLLCGAGPAQVS